MLNSRKILKKLEIIEAILDEELNIKKNKTNKRKEIVQSFISGIAKGLGVSIGIVVLGALVVMILRDLVSLPVIGKYIAEIIEMVELYTK